MSYLFFGKKFDFNLKRTLTKENISGIIGLGYFQIFRGFVINFIITYPFIPYSIKFVPLIPSVFVSYVKSDDYYYSGHIGTTLIVSMEFFRHGSF